MKVNFDRRSRFYKGLRAAGLKPGQIQHVQNLYNQGKTREAAAYMRQHGVSTYRRRATRDIRMNVDSLWAAAREAKKRKLGTDRMMEHATLQELRDLIEKSPEELRRQASNQRAHNPFWYHTRRSYFERQLGVPRTVFGDAA